MSHTASNHKKQSEQQDKTNSNPENGKVAIGSQRHIDETVSLQKFNPSFVVI